MKNYLLLAILAWMLPLSTYAHGESAAMLVAIGYVFIVPFLAGVIDYYLLKPICSLQRYGLLKTTLSCFLITVGGYLLSFGIIERFNIRSEKLEFLLVIIMLTAIQSVLKVYAYRWMVARKKEKSPQMIRKIAGETLIINSFFTMLMLILL